MTTWRRSGWAVAVAVAMAMLNPLPASAANFTSCSELSFFDRGALVTTFASDPDRSHCCIGTSECRWKQQRRRFVTAPYCSIRRTSLDCSRIKPFYEDGLDFEHDGEFVFLNPTDLDMRPELSTRRLDRDKVLADLQIDAPTSIVISAHVSTNDSYLRAGRTPGTIVMGRTVSTDVPYRVPFGPEEPYRVFGAVENCTPDRQRIFVAQSGGAILNGLDCVIVKEAHVRTMCTGIHGDGPKSALETLGVCGPWK